MWIVGDVHGATPSYLWLINNLIHPKGAGKGLDCSLQVGDMGIFKEQDAANLPVMPQHKFFRGNHDNPELCRNHPNHLGDFGYLPKQEMFWMCGGYSIDQHLRIIGVSWWENEELNWDDLKSAIQLYAKTKPRIMMSHECPSAVKAQALAANRYVKFNDKLNIVSRTENALSAMLDAHKPEIWVFGHYHAFLDTQIDGVRFVGLGDHRTSPWEQVFEIPGLTW